MKPIKSILGILACSALLAARPVAAAPLDSGVPADSLIYIGWAGADALAPQYNGSNLKSIIEASTIRAFINEQLPKLIEEASKNDPNAPQQIDSLKAGLDIAWRHPTAFYFAPLDLTNIRKPNPNFSFICDAGADAPALAKLLTSALAQVPPNPDVPFGVTTTNGIVELHVGAPRPADQKGNLGASPEFKKAMAQGNQPNPAVAIYVDVKRLRDHINDMIAKAPDVPPEARVKIPMVVEALGLNSLTQLAYTGAFDNKGWTDSAFLGITGPRKGLLSLAQGAPLSDTALDAVPKDAAAFSAFKFDVQKLISETRALLPMLDPQAPVQLDRALAMGKQELGVDIEKDVLAPMGDEFIYYRAPIPDVGGLTMALVTKLKDGPTLSATLDTLEKVFNEKSGAPVKIEKVDAGENKVSALILLQYNVAWTVRNGYLYVSTISGISSAIDQVEKKAPSITTSDLYKAVRASLPQNVKPSSITYSHPARLYPELRTLLLGFIPLARAQNINIPMDLLPDPARIAKFMTPGGAISWSDADGIHAVGKSAFPAAEILGGQQVGPSSVAAVAAVGAAVALPAAAKSRELASRSIDASSLRGIAMSSMVYASNNNDNLPPHLGVLLMGGDVSPHLLTSRRAGTPPLVYDQNMERLAKDNFQNFSKQVDEHSSFVYLGAGLKTNAGANVILAYEKPGPWSSDGINAAFMDGHVEFLRWPAVPAAFATTNDFLKKNNKPTVDIDALVQRKVQTAVELPATPLPANLP